MLIGALVHMYTLMGAPSAAVGRSPARPHTTSFLVSTYSSIVKHTVLSFPKFCAWMDRGHPEGINCVACSKCPGYVPLAAGTTGRAGLPSRSPLSSATTLEARWLDCSLYEQKAWDCPGIRRSCVVPSFCAEERVCMSSVGVREPWQPLATRHGCAPAPCAHRSVSPQPQCAAHTQAQGCLSRSSTPAAPAPLRAAAAARRGTTCHPPPGMR